MKRCKSDDIMIQINEQFDQKSVHKQNSDRSNTQRHKTKKNSYHSVINSIEQNNINNLKLKQLLTRLTLMGYNAYMAEYIIQKEKIKTDLQIEQLVVILIEKIAEIDQEHHRMSACQIKQKIIPKANQILPIQDLPSEQTQQDLNLPECGICVCPMEQKYTIAKCNHVFCLNCVQTYLQERIKESNVMEMPCPQLFCTNIITDDAMKLLITDDQYKKYEEFKARKLLEQDDQVRWCVRAGCPGYVKCGLFQKVVYCECGQGICFTCKGEAHGNLTCEQALDQQYEQVLKALIIQKCPKCRAPIQKKEGCNHMTCFQCKFQFCWICRARYTRMHFDPDNCFGCPDMQFFNVDPQPRQKWKKYGGILFELFASILILPILPIFLMYYAIMAPLKLCKRFNRHKYTQNYDDCDKFMLILLGMCTFPIFLALEICPGSLIYLLYKLRYD